MMTKKKYNGEKKMCIVKIKKIKMTYDYDD